MCPEQKAGVSRSAGSAGSRSGQAILEHVVVAGVMLVVLIMLALFLYVFKEYGGRIFDLVGSDYP
jgi:hypothetical protein